MINFITSLQHYHDESFLKTILPFVILLLPTAIKGAVATETNAPVLADIRVEGANSIIFEGRALTRGHNVTTPGGGSLHRDGTNADANPTPGATCTSALADASRVGCFTLDGYLSIADYPLPCKVGLIEPPLPLSAQTESLTKIA